MDGQGQRAGPVQVQCRSCAGSDVGVGSLKPAVGFAERGLYITARRVTGLLSSTPGLAALPVYWSRGVPMSLADGKAPAR